MPQTRPFSKNPMSLPLKSPKIRGICEKHCPVVCTKPIILVSDGSGSQNQLKNVFSLNSKEKLVTFTNSNLSSHLKKSMFQAEILT